ncbi:hypothetical protein QG516_23380 [Pedobacter gandavensis]|uniref:hypothetical protein n=1 Tax=Pedobacter TaxID=84567 RepID=UPI001C98ECE8|nr:MULTISPECIES: hypothetical protein [Pedobacter]WGQ09461.1 hypothetical protein QG516_23380 [Pedobacter gandavensis]
MSKQIKALKCPQCGSVKKQEVKEDHYICNNCGTEYFLDNDDINVNIRHSYTNHGSTALNPKARKIIFSVLGAIILVILLQTFLGIFFDEKSKSGAGSSKAKEYHERFDSFIAYSIKDSPYPILLFKIIRSTYGDRGADQYLMRFYDPTKNKVLNDEPMTEWKDSYYLRSQLFSDGHIYICPDKSNRVYLVNQERNTLEDMTSRFFGNLPELSSGIATLGFISEKQGDGFKIMTNDGKEYSYYPLSRKIYSGYQELREAKEGLESLYPGAVETVHYIFSEKSNEYPEEKVQLIKYWYKNNPGYPVQHPYNHEVKWRKVRMDPTGSGRYTGTYTYEKKLFAEPRFTRFIDLTPDRMFFDADIVYQDSANLYIKGLPNANPQGNPFIQKIDSKTGKVIWSYTPPVVKYSFDDHNFYGYRNGLVFNYYNYGSPGRVNKIVIIDNAGKMIKELDADNLFDPK